MCNTLYLLIRYRERVFFNTIVSCHHHNSTYINRSHRKRYENKLNLSLKKYNFNRAVIQTHELTYKTFRK